MRDNETAVCVDCYHTWETSDYECPRCQSPNTAWADTAGRALKDLAGLD